MRRSLALAVMVAGAAVAPTVDRYAAARERMVAEQIEARGIRDVRVLAAMRQVPRHELVPEAVRDRAYEDHPVAIGHGQTISQPYIVALMTELAHVEPGDRVLEVGTGSGYQAAVLAACGAEVWTIEIVEELAKHAERALARIGVRGVHVRSGDGYLGWPEAAPFDAIVVTAAAPRVPEALLAQLRVGGRLVIPVEDTPLGQSLQVHTRTAQGVSVQEVAPVQFVPMVGGVRGRAPRD